MRILNYLFFSVVFVLIVSVVGFLFSRELVLFIARTQLDSSLTQLSKARATGTVQSVCLQRSGAVSEDSITYQLRFTSSSEYVLEGICPGFSQEPVFIDQKKLPVFTTKALGNSGFILKPAEHGIILQAFKKEIEVVAKVLQTDLQFLEREKTLIVQNGSLTNKTNTELLGVGPTASCEGYGYSCCDLTASVGEGDQLLGVRGCEQSCFTSCSARPVVLSFNSSPFPEPTTRTVTIARGESIQFNYTISSSESKLAQAQIAFGDGNTTQLSELFGQVAHTYACAQASCTYTAILTAENAMGNSSAQTSISTIKIVVQ